MPISRAGIEHGTFFSELHRVYTTFDSLLPNKKSVRVTSDWSISLHCLVDMPPIFPVTLKLQRMFSNHFTFLCIAATSIEKQTEWILMCNTTIALPPEKNT